MRRGSGFAQDEQGTEELPPLMPPPQTVVDGGDEFESYPKK